MCLCGAGKGVYMVQAAQRGFKGEGPHSCVFCRQLEPALELGPERAELEPLSILLSAVGGDLSWKTVPLGYLLLSL